MLPDVWRSFWTMQASAKHHHARPGGLAVHSREAAEDLERIPRPVWTPVAWKDQ